MLDNVTFKTIWPTYYEMGKESVKQLLVKIVDRVFVYDDKVIAVIIFGDYSIILDAGQHAPQEIVQVLASGIKKLQTMSSSLAPTSELTGSLPAAYKIYLLPSLKP